MMRIIDIDCIQTKRDADLVNGWISNHIYKDRNGNIKKKGPIKFISSKIKDPEEFERLVNRFSLYALGEFVHVPSIKTYLGAMVQECDRHAVEHGMAVTGRFRCKHGQHQVLTNREFSAIEYYGAAPIPAWLLGIMGAGNGNV